MVVLGNVISQVLLVQEMWLYTYSTYVLQIVTLAT